MSDLVWEEPPSPATGTPGEWAVRLAPLRERPGEWARVDGLPEGSVRTTASRIQTGRAAGVAAGDYEAVSRRVNGRNCMYVRYVGEVQP